MNTENKKLTTVPPEPPVRIKRRRRFMRWWRFTLITLILFLVFIYAALPFAVEQWVLPPVAKACGVEFFTAEVRHIGISAIDLADIAVGREAGGDQLHISSIRLDWKLGRHGLIIKRVVVSGLTLDADITGDKQFILAGKTLAEWLEPFHTTSIETTENIPQNKEIKPAGKPWVVVEKLELEHARLNLDTPNGSLFLPLSANVRLPSPQNPIARAAFQINTGRDRVAGNSYFNVLSGDGEVKLSVAIAPQRYLSIFPDMRVIPLAGQLGIELTSYIKMSPFKVNGTLKLANKPLVYGHNLKLSPEFIWQFSGDGNELNFSGSNPAGNGIEVNYNDQYSARLLEISGQWRGGAARNLALQTKLAFDAVEHGVLTSQINIDLSKTMRLNGEYQLTSSLGSGEPLQGKFNFDQAEAVGEFTLSGKADSSLAYKFNGMEFLAMQPELQITARKESTEWFTAVNGSIDQLRIQQAANNAVCRQVKLNADFPGPGKYDALLSGKTVSGQWNGQSFQVKDWSLTGKKQLNDPNLSGLFTFKLAEAQAEFLPFKISEFNFTLPWNSLKPVTDARNFTWHFKTDSDYAADGSIKVTDSGWLLDGKIHSSLFPDAPSFELDAAIKPELLLQADFVIPDQHPNIAILTEWFPALAGWETTGLIGADVHYQYGYANNQGTAELRIKHLDVANSGLELAASGINTTIRLPALPKLSTTERLEVAVDEVKFKNMVFNNLFLGFQLFENELFIDEAGTDWCGGRVYTYAVHLRKNNPEINTNIFCDALSLSEFINTFGIGSASGDGRIYGRVPIRFSPQKGIYFKRGYLYSEPGVKDTIQLGHMAIPENSGVAELDIATESLKKFVYDWVKIDFSTDTADNVVIAAVFNGQPAGNLPFTFDSEKGGFVRVDYNGAHFQGINLTLRWKVPLNQLLEFNNMYKKLTQGEL